MAAVGEISEDNQKGKRFFNIHALMSLNIPLPWSGGMSFPVAGAGDGSSEAQDEADNKPRVRKKVKRSPFYTHGSHVFAGPIACTRT
jgi:hypothetical protein